MSDVRGSTNVEAKRGRTNVENPDDLRGELIRIAEDGDAGDLDTMEDRVSALLSDVRRAQAGDLE